MKYLITLILLYVSICWSIPKPMEAAINYNVLMVHGAYGSDKGIDENENLKEADSTSEYLGDATLGCPRAAKATWSWRS